MKRLILFSMFLAIILVAGQSRAEMFNVCHKTCNSKEPSCQCSGCCVAYGCNGGGTCRNNMCVCAQCPVKTVTSTRTGR